MSHDKGCVTFNWSVENFNSNIKSTLFSPFLVSYSLNDTKWQISITWVDAHDHFSFCLRRCETEYKAIDLLTLDCEMSLVDENGWAWKSSNIKNYTFAKNSRWPSKKFVHKTDLYQSNLIIRYQLRRSRNAVTRPELLCAQTQIVKLYFLCKINNFFSLCLNEKKEIYIKSTLLKSPVLTFQLYKKTKNNQINIEIISEGRLTFTFLCNIAVLDRTGKILKSQWGRHSFESKENEKGCCEQMFKFPSFINETEVFQCYGSYLAMNALSLQILCFFWNESATGENISSLNLYVDKNLTSPRPNSTRDFFEHHGKGVIKEILSTDTCDKQSSSVNLPTTLKLDKHTMTGNLPTTVKLDKHTMSENLPTTLKLDKHTMTENLPTTLKFDKHTMTENLTNHHECNMKSLTDNLPINNNCDKLCLPENVSTPIKLVKHTLAENSLSGPEKFVVDIQSMAKNLPRVQDMQSLVNNLSTKESDGLFIAKNLPSISDKHSLTNNLSCPRKINVQSVSTNSPSFQDKQCLSNNLSESKECDNLSMTKNFSCTQLLGRQSEAENLPNPQKKQPLAHYLFRNKEFVELSMTENLLYPSKSDIKSVDKKSPKPQDKQSLVNNLSVNQDCDELSMPDEMSCPETLHIQSNAGITPRMKTIDQSITDPDSFMSGNTCWRETAQEKTDAYYLKRFVDDIYSAYKNGWLSDFRLYSGNKTFPVHKIILSARSPVFRAMFVSTLKDKDGLDIPDIDVDTLERMLLFIYSNKVEDLEWNTAINLYSAAHRYAIADLKRITRSSLISKISASNVLGILVQANLHEDEDLKSWAERFIVENDDDIVGTEDWKKFEKEHVHLAVQILSILYVRIKNKLIK